MQNKMPGEEQNRPEVTIDGPGSQLRRARERQGIEQSKVAAQLHLNQETVQALEWDDYEKLPSAVFVKGYLRNYARLLGVNEDAVISAYQALNPGTESEPLPRNQPDEVARELHGNHGIFRYITWVVVLLMGVLIFFWWQGRMQLPEPDTLAPVEENQGDGPGLPLQDQMSLSPVPPETEFSLPPEEAAPIPDEAISGVQAIPSEPSVELEAQPLSNQDTPTDEAPSPTQEMTSPLDQEIRSDVSQTADRGVSTAAVFFEFLGPCWVEVRDATGRARIIGEMRAGVRRSLDGSGGPYKVVIGDVNAVRLMVNSEALDLKTYARGKVARFTLDPAQR
jgi:cytoskeleton protein RodZ